MNVYNVRNVYEFINLPFLEAHNLNFCLNLIRTPPKSFGQLHSLRSNLLVKTTVPLRFTVSKKVCGRSFPTLRMGKEYNNRNVVHSSVAKLPPRSPNFLLRKKSRGRYAPPEFRLRDAEPKSHYSYVIRPFLIT